MRVKYNEKAVSYLNENLENKLSFEDFLNEKHDFLSQKKDFYLEIGPGKGKFIIDLAARYLNLNFIVCEINKTIAGYCLKAVDESDLKNVKVCDFDFYKLAGVLKKDFFSGIFLNFSDPWPKKRHTKRRLTSDQFFKEYFKILKLNHYIYFKSDNDRFYEFSLEQAKKFKFEIVYNNLDYKDDDLFDSKTEYEEKFLQKGIKIKRFIAKKVEDTVDEINEN